MNRKSPLKLKCSLLIYQSIIRPIITYACPIWGTASKTLVNKVQVLQNKILRISCNTPWFVRNSKLHEELGVIYIHEFIKKSAKDLFLTLPLCDSAEKLNLGVKTRNNHLKKRLPQDVLISNTESESE